MKSGLTDIENKLMVNKGEREGGRKKLGVQIRGTNYCT